MTQNSFPDKSQKPTVALLASVLGSRMKYFEELRRSIEREYGPVVADWKFYGKTIGWTMKLLLGKRNLLFLTACEGFFAVSFVFGEKAVSVVRSSILPKELIEQLVTARKYAEGRGIRVEVKSREALKHVLALVDIKAGN